jgi:hypothetical protein
MVNLQGTDCCGDTNRLKQILTSVKVGLSAVQTPRNNGGPDMGSVVDGGYADLRPHPGRDVGAEYSFDAVELLRRQIPVQIYRHAAVADKIGDILNNCPR